MERVLQKEKWALEDFLLKRKAARVSWVSCKADLQCSGWQNIAQNYAYIICVAFIFFKTAFYDFRRWWILPDAYIIQALWKLIWYHALTCETTLVLQILMVTLILLMLAYKSVQEDVLLFALIKSVLKFCGLLHFWFGFWFFRNASTAWENLPKAWHRQGVTAGN